MKRWRGCCPRPLGARRVERGVTERASAPTHRTRQCTEPAPRIQRHSTLHQSCFPPLKADCRLRYRFVVGEKYSRSCDETTGRGDFLDPLVAARKRQGRRRAGTQAAHNGRVDLSNGRCVRCTYRHEVVRLKQGQDCAKRLPDPRSPQPCAFRCFIFLN